MQHTRTLKAPLLNGSCYFCFLHIQSATVAADGNRGDYMSVRIPPHSLIISEGVRSKWRRQYCANDDSSSNPTLYISDFADMPGVAAMWSMR
jgi:hypothetical protein